MGPLDHACGIGVNEGRIIDQIQKRRLQELCQTQRTLQNQERKFGKGNGSFVQGSNHKPFGFGSQFSEIEKKGIIARGQLRGGLQVVNVRLVQVKGFQMFEILIETTKDSKFSSKWIFTKKHFKDTGVLVFSSFPVRIGHGDLIGIRQQRSHQWIRRSGGRGSCHDGFVR